MHKLKSYILILLISIITSLILAVPYSFCKTTCTSADYSISKACTIADRKQQEALEKQCRINTYFEQGRKHYDAGNYCEALSNFERILEIDPSYEPAKLYAQGARIRMEIDKEQSAICSIKLRMSDIICEFDKRKCCIESLAMKYFIEQAQLKCQLGDYKGAQELYSLCYKISPVNKQKVEWFVGATYDLIKLAKELDSHTKKIDELAVLEK